MSWRIPVVLIGSIGLISLFKHSESKATISAEGTIWANKEAKIPYRNGAHVLLVPSSPRTKVTHRVVDKYQWENKHTTQGKAVLTNQDGKFSLSVPWRANHYGLQIYEPIHTHEGNSHYHSTRLPTINYSKTSHRPPLFIPPMIVNHQTARHSHNSLFL